MSLRLQPTLHAAIRHIATIDDAVFDEMITALERMSPVPYAASIREHLKHTCPHVSALDISAFVDVAFGIHAILQNSGIKKEALASSVKESVQTNTISGAPSIDEIVLTKRLEALLTARPLAISAKANSLLFESERHLVGARILTDIRPLFEEDPSGGPLATIVTHSLRIQYHEGKDVRELFLGLDPSDIQKLILTLQRATQKEECLKRFISERGRILNIDTTPSESDS